MDIRTMRYVLTVIKTGSLNKAAEQLYLSPQALGKTVRMMEAELGAELFTRQNHMLSPTAFGRAFAREAEGCIASFDRACGRISALARQAAGNINIACAYGVPNALGYENPSILREMLRKRTGLELEIAFDELPDLLAERELREGSCDIGLLMGEPENMREYETVPLKINRLVAVVRPEHPLAKRSSLSVKELEHWSIASRNRYYRSYHILENYARRHQIALHYGLCSPDESLWRQKVSEGAVGIGISFWENSAHQSGFSVIPFEETEMSYPILLARRKDREMDEKLRALWTTIAAD